MNTNKPEQKPQCPKCGYTKEDAQIHGDHHLCSGKIPIDKEEQKRLLIEMMREDEKSGMYEKSDNELIAEFMGLEKVRMVPVILSDGKGTRSESPVYRIGFKELLPHQLKYDVSWDHLTPVVEKILDTADPNVRDINSEGLAIFELGLGTPIKDVHKACVDYIKWFNSQQHERK